MNALTEFFPFVCDSYLPSTVRNKRAKHGAVREDLPMPARCRNAARNHLCGHGFWATLFNRHSPMKRRQTVRMPVPCCLESAIVLKSGAKRPVAGDVLQCARLSLNAWARVVLLWVVSMLQVLQDCRCVAQHVAAGLNKLFALAHGLALLSRYNRTLRPW